MASNPTIVLAKLDSKELMASIDDLVNSVGDKTQKMAMQFEKSINIMNDAMKNFAVTQKVSVDTMKEAWREMSASFDAMVKAQGGAKGGSGSGSRGKAPTTYADNTVGALEQSIKLHQREQKALVLNTDELRKQNNLIEQQKNLLQSQKRPRMSMKEVLGMDESSLDAIRQKLRALGKVGINPQNAKQAKLLGDEYARLSIKQKELMGKNSLLYNSNNALARSFNYIRNRIIYAFTVTAVVGFVKELYRVRGEYEMLERSLGVLTNDMRRGSEIFQELNQMALKSPFTLVELGTAAKQLTAYNFAADEVVETTRRLADISAALGVPMERLVYNLGQIKAQGALTARDARDFANAGLAIVPMLAEMYTKQKKFGDELVTTAQVYDMMSKKMVSYSDVMKVINSITDEGGKFFDYQAKQADTLKVQLANLSLAYNNMLNEIGSEQQEVIELPIKTLRYLYENWRQVASIVKTVAMAYGIYKAAQLSILALHFAQKVLLSAEAMYKLGVSVRGAITSLKALGIVIKSNPMGLLASVLAGVAGYFLLFQENVDDATEYTERFGKAGGKVVREAETLFDTIGNITKGTSNYKKVLGELNSILDEYGIAQVKESDNIDQINAKRAVAIDLIKQEALERKHLNDIQQGEDTYNKATDEAKKNLRDSLKDAYTGKELAKNADAISNIISDAVTQNISLIANKTGKEYENGMNRIFSIIQDRMRAIGLSEKTIQDDWVRGMFFGRKNIVLEYVKVIQDAKEAQDAYTEAMNKAFEAEMREAQAHTTVRDRIAATNRILYNARTDSEKFYNAIDKIIKDFSGGQNIVDFLVRVKTDVPNWMMNMSLDDLSRLAARFAALAQNAKGAMNVNGKMMTKEELAIRAAQYAQAYKNKQEEEGTNITKAASEALRKYKEALDAVRVAQNLVAQGEKDEAFLKRKQTEEQNAYNKALKAGVSAQELYEAKYGKSGKGGAKKDEFAETVKEEIKVIGEARKQLEDYRKTMSNTEAIKKVNESYGATFEILDKKFQKFNTYGLGAGDITSKDLREIRDYYSVLLDIAKTRGSEKDIEALDKAWADLGVSISKIDNKRIVESLNSELGKLKEEYELAVALDADPELGDVFSSYFGINKDTLPHDFEQAAKLAQERIDKVLKDSGYTGTAVDISKLLDKAAFEQWAKENGLIVDNELRKAIEAFREYLHKTQVDEIKSQEESWKKLLEKYAEYEYRTSQITKNADRERETLVQKFGTDGQKERFVQIKTQLDTEQDPEKKDELKSQLIELVDSIASSNDTALQIKTAIDTKELRDYADLDFTEFQKTGLWAVASGDLTGMTKTALRGLIDSLEEYKTKAKNLDPKQIKQINRALKSLHSEVRKDSPFSALADTMEQASLRSEDLQADIDALQASIDKINSKPTKTKQDEEEIARLTNKIKELKGEQKALSKVSMKTVMDEVTKFTGAISGAASMVGDLAQAFGDTATAKAVKDIGTVLDKIGQGASLGGSVGGGWGAFAGAIVGGAAGMLQVMSDAITGNAKINEQIEDSERRVRRLGNAYKLVESAIDKFIGTGKIGVRQWNVELKKLELAEVERQLRLEESRTSKNRDEDKIIELKGSIIDLRHEIKESTDEIVNDLLGISSVGDAVETLVSSMIDAFKKGEDYMKEYDESFAEMIDNMIVKSIASKVVGDVLNKVWNELDKKTKERGEKYTKPLFDTAQGIGAAQEGIKQAQEAYLNWMKIWQDAKYIMDNSDYPQAVRDSAYEDMKVAEEKMREFATILQVFGAQLPTLQDTYDQLFQEQQEAMRLTPEDVQEVRDTASEARTNAQKIFEEMMAAYGITFGQDAEGAKLSNLQQGIQGITEETAGALEAYMNSVSQQVYLHSTLLTQIRDVMVAFDPEVSMGIQSQMLLQLQQSYQVQMSIESILQGVLNPSGRAFAVEIIS